MLVCSKVTDVTGILTVTVLVAVLLPLSLMAVITAVPGAMPVTLPVGLTVATAGLLEIHVTPRIVALVGLALADRVLVAPTPSCSVLLFTVML